jgi:hypothetical protein
MTLHKFVAELYFDAEDVDDGLRKLAEHFRLLSKGETSYLLQEGSSSAGPGDPELDESIQYLGIVDYNLLPIDGGTKIRVHGDLIGLAEPAVVDPPDSGPLSRPPFTPSVLDEDEDSLK